MAQKSRNKCRLDMRCVELGLAPSRERAKALIMAKAVLVNGEPTLKAGTLVDAEAEVALREQPLPYVSRGGLKLAAALEQFGIDCTDQVGLDVGASTGGFTDCLLQRGACHVVAVDVGYGQLDWKLRQDARVTSIERTNARQITPQLLQQHAPPELLWPPTIAVVDVSFISLTLVLPAMCACVDKSATLIALVKPQFESTREDVGRGGVVRDEHVRQKAIAKVATWAQERGHIVKGGIDSPVPGPKGNVEHLLWIQLTDNVAQNGSES